MNISFRHTVDQVLKGEKTVTRRVWCTKTARCFKAGSTHEAWSALTWVVGAQRVALIEATADAYQERLGDITREDVVAEGFPEMSVSEFVAMYCRLFKVTPDDRVWVARFKVTHRFTGRGQVRP